jgi:hypothetical protein
VQKRNEKFVGFFWNICIDSPTTAAVFLFFWANSRHALCCCAGGLFLLFAKDDSTLQVLQEGCAA